MPFHPYVNFGGNCREAFTRYQEIFGGELFLMPMGDIPAEEGVEVPEGRQDRLAHAALMFDGHLLMASDVVGDDFEPVRNIYVNYSTPDVADAERVFAALSEGGTIEVAAGPTFFSPMFGICVDRFGTPWMVSADAEQPPT
jgi:PhnB protein